MKEIYLESCLKEIPRLLGQIDKNESSPTYGCFDRLYWHFRNLDFPRTIPQYSTLSLALIYSINSKKNFWYKNKDILKYAKAAVIFWTKMQNNNGSFNEAYPNDNSQPATGFSLYFVGEAYNILRKEFSESERRKIEASMKKASYFTWTASESENAVRGDPEVPNHDAGVINSIYLMYQLTKEKKYKKRCEIMINDLLKLQTKEGWFSEYGGADIGYSTFMLFWLSNYYRMSKDEKVKEPINKLVNFLSYFIHPNGSLGGEYGSRTTYFYIPAGFEMAKWNKKAAKITEFMLNSIKNEKVLTPKNFDDQNLASFPFFTLLLSYLHYNKNKSSVKLPFEEKNFEVLFDESKLLVVKRKKYYSIIAGNKGVIKIFDINKKKLIFSDTGWIREGENKISSGIFNENSKIRLNKNNDQLEVINNTQFSKAKFVFSNPLRLAISRIIFPFISKYPFMKKKLKKILRNMVITNKKLVENKLHRKIIFKDFEVIIKDKITNLKKQDKFYTTGNFTNLWSYPGGLLRDLEDYNNKKEFYNGEFHERKIKI